MIPGGTQGAVQAVDRFGNLISNVSGALLPSHGVWSASVAGRKLTGRRTYADVPPNEALALVGSHGFVEIAVHRGDARRALGVRFGDRVQILWA
jgi:S-adenosylmethionine hydrolase